MNHSIANRVFLSQYYSVKQAAAILGVSPKTIYRAIQNGDLPSRKLRGTLRIPRLAVDPDRGTLRAADSRVLMPEADNAGI